jgi:hypothetical protein
MPVGARLAEEDEQWRKTTWGSIDRDLRRLTVGSKMVGVGRKMAGVEETSGAGSFAGCLPGMAAL